MWLYRSDVFGSPSGGGAKPLAVPELQRRGLSKKTYAGRTLWENLLL
jgi:hypothetical protein